MLIIGHRGACGSKPENTLGSFGLALEQGVDMIELDVAKCSSGEIVVMHDQTVDRTTDGTGNVNCLSLEDLKELDAGDGEKVPTLEEVIKFVGTRCKINIEVKDKGIAHDVADIVSGCVNDGNWKFSDFLISAFDYRQLVKFQQIQPYIPVAGVLDDGVPDYFWKHLRDAQAFSVHIGIKFLHKELVERAHREGLKVYSWTVNTDQQYAKAVELEIDGIFTDYPDRFVEKVS